MVIENKIEYREVIEIIKNELFTVMQNDENGTYDSLNVLISNEQFFVKQREEGKLNNNTIYIVVKFMSAAVDYGVTVLPISIIAISEQNHCDLCQRLLQDFTTMVNMETNDTATIQQFYESPVVTSNFNEMYEGFRSVISCSGTFVISEGANPFTLQWWNASTYIDENNVEQVKGWEDVYFITGDTDANFQPDPKLFYESNDYTESIVTMGSVTFNISSILLTDEGFYDEMLKFLTKKQKNYEVDLDPESDTYMQKVLYTYDTRQTIPGEIEGQTVPNPDYMRRTIKIEDVNTDAANVNENIVFKLTFRNGQELIDIFKIASLHIQQVLKKIPMITLVFSN